MLALRVNSSFYGMVVCLCRLKVYLTDEYHNRLSAVPDLLPVLTSKRCIMEVKETRFTTLKGKYNKATSAYEFPNAIVLGRKLETATLIVHDERKSCATARIKFRMMAGKHAYVPCTCVSVCVVCPVRILYLCTCSECVMSIISLYFSSSRSLSYSLFLLLVAINRLH